MTITVQIPPDIETQIRENASLGNTETVRRLLLDALVPTVEALMKPNPQLSVDKLNALADEMADKFMRIRWSRLPPTLRLRSQPRRNIRGQS